MDTRRDLLKKAAAVAPALALGGSLTQTQGAGAAPVVASVGGKNMVIFITDQDRAIQHFTWLLWPAESSGQHQGQNGALRSKRPATVSVGMGASGVAITPLGTYLYTPDSLSDAISQFAIDRRSGRLTALNPPSVAAGERPEGVAMAPNGRSLYSRLRGVSRARLGTGPGTHGLVVSPDQGPVARVKLRRKRAAFRPRQKVRFNASSSSDPDGTVVRYRWRFGDGRSARTAGPRVAHRYRKPGHYRVKVVVTDNERCSTRRLYTGQSTSCNGGPRAKAKRWLRVRP